MYLSKTCSFDQKLEIDNSINYHLVYFALKLIVRRKNEPQIFFACFGSLKHFAASDQLKFGSLWLECFFGSAFVALAPRSAYYIEKHHF